MTRFCIGLALLLPALAAPAQVPVEDRAWREPAIQQSQQGGGDAARAQADGQSA